MTASEPVIGLDVETDLLLAHSFALAVSLRSGGKTLMMHQMLEDLVAREAMLHTILPKVKPRLSLEGANRNELFDFRTLLEPYEAMAQACEAGEEKPVEARKAKDRSARPKLKEIGYDQRSRAQDKRQLIARNPFMRSSTW